jgi:predicted O-methyltransferase YrrM
MIIPGLPPYDAPDSQWNMGYCYRHQYVDIKYRIAEQFKPTRICEIGVYSGIAACCFLAASPTAEYIGIDNCRDEQGQDIVIVEHTRELLTGLGYRSEIIIADSQQMTELPGQFDFIHIDGDHSRDGACHDMLMAWRAVTPTGHILIDNGHDMGVCAGIFDAMYQLTRGLLRWNYFEDSVGNILIYRELLEVRE